MGSTGVIEAAIGILVDSATQHASALAAVHDVDVQLYDLEAGPHERANLADVTA